MAGVAASAWGVPAHLVNTVSHQARRNVGFVQELHDCRSAAPWFSRRGRIWTPTSCMYLEGRWRRDGHGLALQYLNGTGRRA